MARSRPRIRAARLNNNLLLTLIGITVCLIISSILVRTVIRKLIGVPIQTTNGLENNSSNSDKQNRSSLTALDGSNGNDKVPFGSHPLDPVLKLARGSLEDFNENVIDYVATMTKRERIDGTLSEQSTMTVKIINRKVEDGQMVTPMHVYLRFDSPKSVEGREVIWVEGKNDGYMIAHEAGYLNLVRANLAPNGPLAMIGNKYPITEIGIANLLTKLIEKGTRDRAVGHCEVTFSSRSDLKDETKDEESNITHETIRVIHQDKKPEYDFHIVEVQFDRKLNLPISYTSYLWPDKNQSEPQLEEEYSYSDIQLNVGLTDKDFDPENDSYNFP